MPITYPVVIEPYDEMFIARFPDIPELVECLGDDRSDAILNAIERLNWTLTDIFLDGRPMPPTSPIEAGQLGISTPMLWFLI